MPRRNSSLIAISLAFLILLVRYFTLPRSTVDQYRGYLRPSPDHLSLPSSIPSVWSGRIERNPITSLKSPPKGPSIAFPPVQASSSTQNESPDAKAVRLSRLEAVKASFQHSWRGYHDHAWLADEVAPVSGGRKNTFGHWSATLVDSLDTLWIMGLHQEFDEAVEAVASINFEASSSSSVDVFETTIRYVGGLLSAYELSGKEVLLHKAEQLGHMMYAAFDTPSRMPVRFLEWEKVLNGSAQEASTGTISANVGSLGLEFTKLSQLTGNPKFFDAIQRVTDVFAKQQDATELPGMWPIFIDAQNKNFASGNTFTFGGMADSLYEYLPKMHILLGGQHAEYGRMYQKAVDAGKRHLFFRPMNLHNQDILLSGTARTQEGGKRVDLDPEGQHLGCFTGGMVGLGAKIFKRDEDLKVATRLADGCFWAYESMPSGIMPEIMVAVPCSNRDACQWDETIWHKAVQAQANSPQDDVSKTIQDRQLPPGFSKIKDHRYILRPEAIESIFYMYRITGDTIWQDKAWQMYTAINKAAKATYGYSAIENVAASELRQTDSMESFWTAETLKYLFLIFSDMDVISLDEWVLNTEAHPLRRPAS